MNILYVGQNPNVSDDFVGMNRREFPLQAVMREGLDLFYRAGIGRRVGTNEKTPGFRSDYPIDRGARTYGLRHSLQ